MKKLMILCVLVASIIGCSNEKNTEQNKTNQTQAENNQVAAFQSYEMDIEGMTCEIGCARTIESKLSKVKANVIKVYIYKMCNKNKDISIFKQG